VTFAATLSYLHPFEKKFNLLGIKSYLILSSMNIFVAKLNFKTRKEELEAAFAKFGQVTSAKIVRDKDTGRSKGFGFVEMPNDTEANAAIAGLNEKELDGRTIVVKPANPRPTTGTPSE
jgi:RNA recognition motif-containing protein